MLCLLVFIFYYHVASVSSTTVDSSEKTCRQVSVLYVKQCCSGEAPTISRHSTTDFQGEKGGIGPIGLPGATGPPGVVDQILCDEKIAAAIEVLKTNILTLINWHKASNGMFYKVFQTEVNYDTAKKNCVKEGATLASKTIRDPNSFREIQTLLKRDNDNSWIGLDDIQTEGSWEWADGERVGISGVEWGNGEPSNSNGNEDCVHFWDAIGWKLNDSGCNAMMKYICEKSI